MTATSGGPGERTCDLCGKTGMNNCGFAKHYDSGVCRKARLIPLQPNLTDALPPPPTPTPTDLSNHLRQLRQSNRLIRRIPKAARCSVAESLIEVLEKVIRDNDVPSWTRFITFAYQAFSLPDEKRTESLATMVKKNLSRTTDLVSRAEKPRRSAVKATVSKLRKAVERKMQDGDVSGAVRLPSSDDAVAPPTAEVLDVLKAKHPCANADALYPAEPDNADLAFQPVTVEEIILAIKSFPNGSAGGMDGILPQHLKDLTSESAGEIAGRLAVRLATVVSRMLQGSVPMEICPLLYGTCLTALRKKDGGIRPIAVGNTIRRLAAKIVSRRVMDNMGQLVRPAQLGYGTRGGAEAAVHATRAHLSADEETQVLLKLDFQNAFNTVRRDKILLAVQKHLPCYYGFVWQCYRHPSQLFFGDFVLQSESGVQQGDPLGPLLFCLVSRELSSTMRSPLNTWYLDDGTLGGDAESVAQDLETVRTMGRAVGLELNVPKCEAFVFGGDDTARAAAMNILLRVAPDVNFPSREELTLLGAPLLSEAIPSAIDAKTSAIRLLTSRLSELQAHQALFILKNCLGAPKVLHILRCSPTWLWMNKLGEFDNVIRSSVSAITNTAMTDTVWRQATLSVSKGGLGIRRTDELALPAFLASVHAVADLILMIVPDVDLGDVTAEPVRQWCEASGNLAPLLKKVQKEWDTPVVERIHSNLLAVSQLKDKARLLALSAKESGAWLGALPVSSLGTLLDDDCLRISVALRLGAEVCLRHTCRCGSEADSSGHHGLSCGKSSSKWFSRHMGLNDVIKRALVSASIQAILEPPGLERDNGKRPDGMTLVPWKHGRALVWDVTCVDTMCNTNIIGCINAAGHAANEAEKRKTVRPDNLLIRASKSGKLDEAILKDFYTEILFPDVADHGLLLVDSWSAHTDKKLVEDCQPLGVELEVLIMPPGTTGKVQPLDVYGFRLRKGFVRFVSDRVLIDDIPLILHQRNALIQLQSLTHNQMSSPRYHATWRYGWYKAGYLDDHPPEFVTPTEFCFKGPEVDAGHKCNKCDDLHFIKCSWCKQIFCFAHWWGLDKDGDDDSIECHYCNNYVN